MHTRRDFVKALSTFGLMMAGSGCTTTTGGFSLQNAAALMNSSLRGSSKYHNYSIRFIQGLRYQQNLVDPATSERLYSLFRLIDQYNFIPLFLNLPTEEEISVLIDQSHELAPV